MLITLVAFSNLGVLNAAVLQNSQPVLWRASKTPVTAGYERVHLKIRLMNPCEVLTRNIAQGCGENGSR